MLFWILLALVLCHCVVVNGGGMELPSYIPKCSLSDPKLNDCIKEKANEAIPSIAKGDEKFGIPTLSPIFLKEAPIVGLNLTYVILDVYTDDVKDMKVTNVSLDLKSGKLSVLLRLEHFEVTAKNYSIISGKILNISASGHGNYRIKWDGVSIDYKTDLRITKKGGEAYLELVNSTIDTDIERAHFYFENIESPEISDVNAYIDKNWVSFREQVKPAIKTYVTTFLHFPLSVIVGKVPLRKMFLP